MSRINFNNNILISQILVDNENKTMDQMIRQINEPTRSLSIKSMFDYPGNGRISYINPNLANLNVSLYKQTGFNQKIWKYIGSFGQSKPISGFIDSNVANRTPVRYMICSADGDVFTSFVTDYVQFNWDTWSIQDIVYDVENQVYKTQGNIYLFRSNLEAGEINGNSSTVKYDSLGRYGRVFKGDLRYESSQLSCLFGDFDVCQDIRYSGYSIKTNVSNFDDVNLSIMYTQEQSTEVPKVSPYPVFPKTEPGQTQSFINWNPPVFKPDVYNGYYLYIKGVDGFYYDKYYKSNGAFWEEVNSSYTYFEDRDKLDAWKDFVYNNNLKLLKDCQGNKWIVSITDSISRSVENNSSQYPTRISFTWQEVMDASTTPIINFIPYEGSSLEG